MAPETDSSALPTNILVCPDVDNTVRWNKGERLNHYFESRCDQLPADHLAVITEDDTCTFRQLDERANQTAQYFLDQGLKPMRSSGKLASSGT